MKRKLSILKTLAWTIIGLWLTRWIIFRLINLDFATIEIARDFRQIWVVLIPLAVLTLIIKSWKENKINSKKIIKLLIGSSLSIGLIIVLNFFSGFCEWQFSDPVYEHKIEKTEIRNRILNCGAYDSDPTNQLVKTRTIGRYLIKYSEIEKEEIDKNKWVEKQ